MDLIRGKDVNQALTALQFSRKSVARDVAKVLRSAVANAQQKEGFGGEVERLFVSKCHANNGPVGEAGPPRADGARLPHHQADDAPDGRGDRAAAGREGRGTDGPAKRKRAGRSKNQPPRPS